MKVETDFGQTLRRKLVNLPLAFGIALICSGIFIAIFSPTELTIFSWRVTSHYEEVGTIVALMGLVFTMIGWLVRVYDRPS